MSGIIRAECNQSSGLLRLQPRPTLPLPGRLSPYLYLPANMTETMPAMLSVEAGLNLTSIQRGAPRIGFVYLKYTWVLFVYVQCKHQCSMCVLYCMRAVKFLSVCSASVNFFVPICLSKRRQCCPG